MISALILDTFTGSTGCFPLTPAMFLPNSSLVGSICLSTLTAKFMLELASSRASIRKSLLGPDSSVCASCDGVQLEKLSWSETADDVGDTNS